MKNISKGYKYHSVSDHFAKYHAKDHSKLLIWGIDQAYPSWRGSNRIRDISKREAKWIYTIRTLKPVGMNKELDICCFISNFDLQVNTLR